MLCISAAYAVVWCLSFPTVHLSVMFVYRIKTSKHVLKLFTRFSTNISLYRVLLTVRPSSVVNRVPPDRGKLVIAGVCVQHSSEAHLTVLLWLFVIARCYEMDKRLSCNGMLIGTYMSCPTQQCHFEWPNYYTRLLNIFMPEGSGAARILSRGGHSVWSFDKSRPKQFIYLEAKLHYKRKA